MQIMSLNNIELSDKRIMSKFLQAGIEEKSNMLNKCILHIITEASKNDINLIFFIKIDLKHEKKKKYSHRRFVLILEAV